MYRNLANLFFLNSNFWQPKSFNNNHIHFHNLNSTFFTLDFASNNNNNKEGLLLLTRLIMHAVLRSTKKNTQLPQEEVLEGQSYNYNGHCTQYVNLGICTLMMKAIAIMERRHTLQLWGGQDHHSSKGK
jgi:hypothetical protein